jgi:hypothetical protein
MWSPTSPRLERISGPEKFCSSAKKDFFNTIGPKPTSPIQPMTCASERQADIPATRVGIWK